MSIRFNIKPESVSFDELSEWCNENIGRFKWWGYRVMSSIEPIKPRNFEIHVDNEADAMVFKLRWC